MYYVPERREVTAIAWECSVKWEGAVLYNPVTSLLVDKRGNP